MAETLRGTAVIIASKRDPGVDDTDIEARRDDGLVQELWQQAAGMPYMFTLEVTVPGREPYQVGGVHTRVPAKAEKVSMFQQHPIPLTLEVPVEVAADNAERVAIDWKAFIDLPDKAERLKAARERALAIAAQRHAEAMAAANPEHAPSPSGENPAMAWAEAVRAGTLSRQEFDQNTMQLLMRGDLRHADYLAAEARLTEP